MAYTEQNRGRGVCEVRATGAKSNGGYYDATIGAGTDYTQQDAAQATWTNLATPSGGSTTLTSASATFTSEMVGNAINITSGTNFDVGADNTSVYYITAFTNSTTVTLDRSPTSGGAGSNGNGKLGGARASIGGALANQATGGGTVVYVKGGAYTCTSSTSNIDGGKAVPVAGSATNGPTRVIGYSTTRGDMATGTRPAVAFAYGAIFMDLSAAGTECENIDVSCSNTASSVGFVVAAQSMALGCKAYQAVTGFRGASGGTVAHCLADSCANGFGDSTSSMDSCLWCWAKDTITNYGFRCTSNSNMVGCLATGGASYGFYHDSGGMLVNCVAVGNTLSGFYRANSTLARPATYVNCISAYNSTYGYEDAETLAGLVLVYCASVGNTTARSTGIRSGFDQGAVTLAGDPFRDRTNKDFRLNYKGPGVVCRTGGFMNAFPGYSTLLRNQYIGAYPTLRQSPVSSWPSAQGYPDSV